MMKLNGVTAMILKKQNGKNTTKEEMGNWEKKMMRFS